MELGGTWYMDMDMVVVHSVQFMFTSKWCSANVIIQLSGRVSWLNITFCMAIAPYGFSWSLRAPSRFTAFS